MSVCAVNSCGFRGNRGCRIPHGQSASGPLALLSSFLHAFPDVEEDSYLREVWLSFCLGKSRQRGGGNKKRKVHGGGICSKHFCNEDKIKDVKGWHLTSSAIPCLHGPANQGPGAAKHCLRVREEILKKRRTNSCQSTDLSNLGDYTRRAEEARKNIKVNVRPVLDESDEEDELSLKEVLVMMKSWLGADWISGEDSEQAFFYRMAPPRGTMPPICLELLVVDKVKEEIRWQKKGESLDPKMISPGDFDSEKNFLKKTHGNIESFLSKLQNGGGAQRKSSLTPLESLKIAHSLISSVLNKSTKELTADGLNLKKINFLTGQIKLALNENQPLPSSLFRLGTTLRLFSGQSYSYLRRETLLTLPSPSALNAYGAVSPEIKCRAEAHLRGGDNFLTKELREKKMGRIFSEDEALLLRKRQFVACSQEEFTARRRAIANGVRDVLGYKSDALLAQENEPEPQYGMARKRVKVEEEKVTPPLKKAAVPLRLVPVSFEEVQRALKLKSSKIKS